MWGTSCQTQRKSTSLREAVRLHNGTNLFVKKCNCSSGYSTVRCTCRKNKIACSTHCRPSQRTCDNCYDIKSQSSSSPSTQFVLEFRDEHIEQVHNKEWLSDRHITGALVNQKSTFPGMDGMQDTMLQQNMSWDIPTNEYVQIFNISNNHWVTTSNIGAAPDTINIYDSLTQKYSLDDMNLFARFHRTTKDKITFKVMNVQKQYNSYDCGPYALAFATSLLHAQDPTLLSFAARANTNTPKG